MDAYYDADADLEALRNKALGIVGYGNQGRAQALNLRDSGLKVVIGALRDESAQKAESDGFAVVSIAQAVEQAGRAPASRPGTPRHPPRLIRRHWIQ